MSESAFYVMVTAARDEAWKRLWADSTTANYLYYRESSGPVIGSLHAAIEASDGARLAVADRIPSNLTKDQLWRWIHDRSTRLAILAGGGCP